MLTFLFIAIVIFVASGISNLIGFGTGTISIPLLVKVLPYGQTLLLVGIIQWLNGLWKLLGFLHHIQWRTTIIFGIPALIASAIGSLFIFIIPHKFLYYIFGGFLVLYSCTLIFDLTLKIKRTWYNIFGGGIIYGLSAGIFGIRGPIRATFLTSFNLTKKEYIATSGAISFSADISRLFVYIYGGVALAPFLLRGLFIFAPITIIAAYIAQKFVKVLPQRSFEIIVAVFLVVIGLKFLLFGK